MRDSHTSLAVLGNGVRVVAVHLPYLASATVGVFVRAGSAHEGKRLNGISHFVEHMAFKGTHERDCQRINLDAERLGAEVNAYTDKDHTAYHMRGMAGDAGRFVQMLADIVRHSTFPEPELERERQVILHEYIEDEDDALSTAFKLFDSACFGLHPVAQPVIGNRVNIQRFSRQDLLDYVGRHYTGANVVVGLAGDVNPESFTAEVEAAFGSMPAGSENVVQPPSYQGDVRTRRQSGSSQTHVVLGFPIPSLRDDDPTSVVAAALFGEGMSSPLMDEVRERRGLVYYAACSADVLPWCGQFVVEASTAPEHLDEYVAEVMRLLRVQAEAIRLVDLERARNQITVKALRAQEQPFRQLEEAAQDLLVHGNLRSREALTERFLAVSAEQVREAFGKMLTAGATVCVAGTVRQGARERLRELVGR